MVANRGIGHVFDEKLNEQRKEEEKFNWRLSILVGFGGNQKEIKWNEFGIFLCWGPIFKIKSKIKLNGKSNQIKMIWFNLSW